MRRRVCGADGGMAADGVPSGPPSVSVGHSHLVLTVRLITQPIGDEPNERKQRGKEGIRVMVSMIVYSWLTHPLLCHHLCFVVVVAFLCFVLFCPLFPSLFDLYRPVNGRRLKTIPTTPTKTHTTNNNTHTEQAATDRYSSISTGGYGLVLIVLFFWFESSCFPCFLFGPIELLLFFLRSKKRRRGTEKKKKERGDKEEKEQKEIKKKKEQTETTINTTTQPSEETSVVSVRSPWSLASR